MADANVESNALLAELEPTVRGRFLPYFQRVDLRRADVIHSDGQMVEWVYFPLTGLVAVLTQTIAGESVQTGMIGCNGAVGVLEAFGSGRFRSRGEVQIPGTALRVGVGRYREMLHSSPALQAAVEQHLEMLVTEARQLMACNALHPIEGRLSRSILDALDRSCLDRVLPLTQEALAQMLGAQRTSVSGCIAKLQRRGLIRSSRGAIEVLDVARLEQVACDCRVSLALAMEEIWTTPDRQRSASG
ncbi:Crp/Fnr family transcriptional regulator [Sphingomonas lycopersici]|uniref:Crp/Fnr family transcriptional regulator n=1 Tax=Sphingomonas lycopersici TaxID=2951807 RepID=A0AA42CT17_9SPHN|nr:Crp/Fnr family transcriptional regulator [Sphingomonas lycopersici]MCW6533916.1 Crp/Fnr family transcriptional regulator [Sphingomonas lycopersici]